MSADGLEGDQILAQSFADLARLLATAPTVDELLSLVVELATRTVGHCESAGITQVVGRTVMSPASSSAVAVVVDRIQGEVDEGPCLDALREHEIFRTGHLRTEQRWPKFSARAHRETGIESILSIRLYLERDTLGSLNLYSRETDAFDDGDVAVATMFATHVSVALSSATRQAQLAARGDSRDLIGRAKGILMALRQVDDARAFQMLVEASQRLNVKLIEVAEDVNLTGEIRLHKPGGTTDTS